MLPPGGSHPKRYAPDPLVTPPDNDMHKTVELNCICITDAMHVQSVLNNIQLTWYLDKSIWLQLLSDSSITAYSTTIFRNDNDFDQCTAFRSHAEDDGIIAVGDQIAELWSLMHAVLYRCRRTRNCSRKATEIPKYSSAQSYNPWESYGDITTFKCTIFVSGF